MFSENSARRGVLAAERREERIPADEVGIELRQEQPARQERRRDLEEASAFRLPRT